MPAPTPLSTLAPAALESARHARAIAWARSIPPQTGTAWQSVALAEMGVAAWEHVPALLEAIDVASAPDLTGSVVDDALVRDLRTVFAMLGPEGRSSPLPSEVASRLFAARWRIATLSAENELLRNATCVGCAGEGAA